MIEKIIAFCGKNRFLVFVLTAFGILWGGYALKNIPIDAIPDLSDPQVIVFTEWMGRSPQLVEDQITYPIVSALVTAPRVTVARGISMFGMSFVYLIFEDGTDIYWARSRVLEYLSNIQGTLPEKVNPVLGPDATGVGWVLSYSLVDTSGKNSIEDLRALQDWNIRYQLEALSGVAEVASVGGYQKQYEIQINPNALAQYQLTLRDIADKVRESNRDVGGRIFEMSEREYFVRGLGYFKNMKDIENISLRVTDQGAPLYLKDVASVAMVPEIRRGAVDFNGEGEAVSAIVVMRFGENAYRTLQEVKGALEKIQKSLPDGVKIIITYDRSKIIGRAVNTLKNKLTEEMLVVAGIIFIFLWHFRSSLVPILTLPIAVLFSFIPMFHLGVNSNIMSLGGIAIAIGAMVDASIIIIENAHKAMERWERDGRKENLGELLLKACQEVGRPIFFSLLVIAVSFLPIFALTGQEGRLFKPLAFTKNFSMFFAALLSITLVPPLVLWLLKIPKKLRFKNRRVEKTVNFFWAGTIHPEERHPISRFLFRIYTPALNLMLKHPKKAIAAAGLMILTIIPVYRQLGQEFLPPLNEGDLLYMPITLPGISIEKAREWLQQQDKIIMQFPEVETVFGKVGRAETSTDPAPLSMVETLIQLHPLEDWPAVYHDRWYSSWASPTLKKFLSWIWPEMKPRTWEELIADLDRTVKLPGTPNAWLFPIRTRIDMLTTGIRTPVGIKVFGDDLETLDRTAVEIEEKLQTFTGTRSVIAERSGGGYYLDIKPVKEKLAMYGLTIEDVNEVVEGAIGSMNLTTTVEGRERFPVNMRYQRNFRQNLDNLKRSFVTASGKEQIPLQEVADVTMTMGPSMIRDENGLLSTWVFVDLQAGQDMGSYVKRLNEFLQNEISFPKGFTYSIAGQYEYYRRAKQRLLIIVPITLFVIILLLYLNTRSWIRTAIILLAVPFSLIGAFWLLYFLGYNMSIAVWVGLIALAGVDAETGVVMLLYLDLAYRRRQSQGKMHSLEDLKSSIREGAVQRVRPKVMTVLTTFFGLLPIMWAATYESGADLTKRIAAPMVGGIFTSFMMELLIYPCIFMIWKWRSEVSKSAP